jgi:hypothetical protein
MRLLRIGLPAVIAVAGVALIIFGGDSGQGAGVVLVGVALVVVLLNGFMQLSLQSEREREQEERYRELGQWPDEP